MKDRAGSDTRPAPDVARTSRFAMVVGVLLLAYVLAGGSLEPRLQTPFLNFSICFERPEVLLFFFVLISALSSYRYWYYGVKTPVTRTRVRAHLLQPSSVLIIMDDRESYAEAMKHLPGDERMLQHVKLEAKVPPGLSPYDFIVFTDKLVAPTEGYLRQLVKNRVNLYYPGISRDEIDLQEHDSTFCWARVQHLKAGTRLRATLEDIDLYAPLLINATAIALVIAVIVTPWVLTKL